MYQDQITRFSNMTVFTLEPEFFTISKGAAYRWDLAMKFSNGHVQGKVVEEIMNEFHEQHPFTGHLEAMPKLKELVWDYLDLVEVMELNLDKIRKGTATAATYQALQNNTPERINKKEFLEEQYSFYQEVTGNEQGISFNQMEEILKDYRYQLDVMQEEIIERRIYRFGA